MSVVVEKRLRDVLAAAESCGLDDSVCRFSDFYAGLIGEKDLGRFGGVSIPGCCAERLVPDGAVGGLPPGLFLECIRRFMRETCSERAMLLYQGGFRIRRIAISTPIQQHLD